MTDKQRAAENTYNGHTLCKRCNGTGNQLLSMHQKCEACAGTGIGEKGKPFPVYKLSPELSDGDHWMIAEDALSVAEAVKSWADYAILEESEDGFEVEVIQMTRQAINELPDI